MRYLYLTILAIFFVSCEASSFDSDRRQLVAKDEIHSKLHNITAFDVTGFHEDTLTNYPDSNFKRPLRYTLDISYKDSTGIMQKKTGYVIFTPNGKSIISSQIIGESIP